MPALDTGARSMLEEMVDSILKRPKDTESGFRSYLKAIGIEADLEAVLSFIAGYLYGSLRAWTGVSYRRAPNAEELNEFISLIRRRASEIREVFLSERVDK